MLDHMEHQRPLLVVLTNIPTPYRSSFFEALAEEADRSGVGVEVWYCATTEQGRHWPFDPRAQRYPFKVLEGWHPRCFDMTAHFNPGVARLIRKVRPAWILTAGAWNMPSAILAALTRRPVTNCLFWSEGHSDAVLHATGLVATLRRAVLRQFDGFAVPNRRSEEFIRHETGELHVPMIQLPNTVDETFYRPPSKEERNAARGAVRVDPEHTLVFCAARLETHKGVRELVEGWTRLSASRRKRAVLAIAGDGALRRDLEAAARIASADGTDIRLLGQLPQSEMRRWFFASDLLIHPSHRDPNPLTPIEAGLSGLPLILSVKAGNAFDIINEGHTGFLIPSITPQMIATTLDHALGLDRMSLAEMGREAEKHTRNQFARHAVAKHFIEALQHHFPPDQRADR
jgi:glycosyltransferase involved in cell wall biosynthesis